MNDQFGSCWGVLEGHFLEGTPLLLFNELLVSGFPFEESP